jgi:hypothetical protein
MEEEDVNMNEDRDEDEDEDGDERREESIYRTRPKQDQETFSCFLPEST